MAQEGADLKHILNKFTSNEIIAGNGEHSSKNRLAGRRGTDIEVPAPVGVTVYTETGKKLYELNEEGAKCVAAYGGSGGCSGNNFIGKKGQDWTVTLDLKLIADVGLVGFPNAGKSTFLKAMSKARPKIASYPFTTIKPNIGIIQYPDYRQISIADLPGLIEGAHKNIGMGHSFLKHVERTKLLIFIVDIFGFQLSPRHPRRNFLENIFSLMKEIEMYDASLMQRPSMLLLNKIDHPDSQNVLLDVQKKVHNLQAYLDECHDEVRPSSLIEFDSILTISAKERMGLDHVRKDIRRILDLYAEREKLQEEQING